MTGPVGEAAGKRCTKCKHWKPFTGFIPRTDRPGKFQSACRICISDYNAARYASDPDLHKATAQAWQAANANRVLENVSRYQRANRAKRVLIRHRQRVALRAFPKIAPESVESRVALFGNKCWMCGGAFEVLDHVKPLAKGGPNILANLRPACKPCNGRKHAKWFGPSELHRFIT